MFSFQKLNLFEKSLRETLSSYFNYVSKHIKPTQFLNACVKRPIVGNRKYQPEKNQLTE